MEANFDPDTADADDDVDRLAGATYIGWYETAEHGRVPVYRAAGNTAEARARTAEE